MVAVRTAAYNQSMPRKDKDQERDDRAAESDEEQEDQNDSDDGPPAGTKRREGPDNLRRRSEWFQKRTGGDR